MKKINFHGEKINLEKAKSLLDKLKEGSITLELTEEERRGYELFKENTNEEVSEIEYLTTNLETLIAIYEHHDRIKYD
jgi:hypothetical protein